MPGTIVMDVKLKILTKLFWKIAWNF